LRWTSIKVYFHQEPVPDQDPSPKVTLMKLLLSALLIAANFSAPLSAASSSVSAEKTDGDTATFQNQDSRRVEVTTSFAVPGKFSSVTYTWRNSAGKVVKKLHENQSAKFRLPAGATMSVVAVRDGVGHAAGLVKIVKNDDGTLTTTYGAGDSSVVILATIRPE